MLIYWILVSAMTIALIPLILALILKRLEGAESGS